MDGIDEAVYIRRAGRMGKDFINYYGGNVKIGDTHSLLYMMDGEQAIKKASHISVKPLLQLSLIICGS